MNTCFHWRGYFKNNKAANKWKMFSLWLENFMHVCNACWLNIYPVHLTQNLPHHSHHFSSQFHVIPFLNPWSSLSDGCAQTPTEAWVALERILGLSHILLNLWLLYLRYTPWNKTTQDRNSKTYFYLFYLYAESTAAFPCDPYNHVYWKCKCFIFLILIFRKTLKQHCIPFESY